MRRSVIILGKLIDLTSKNYGRLTVIQRGPNIGKSTAWYCQCSCGNPKLVLIRGDHLKSGATQSCGCLHKASFSQIAKQNKKDLTGQTFGELKVLRQIENERYNNGLIWECLCSCGNIIKVPAMHLSNGHTHSCGCIGRSVGENNITKILKDNNIIFEQEKVFTDQLFSDTAANGRYDFYLPLENRLIEFDGEQHFKKSNYWNQYNLFNQQQLHDKEKNEYALSHNIPLVRIPYWERDNITLEMIMGDKYLVKKDE